MPAPQDTSARYATKFSVPTQDVCQHSAHLFATTAMPSDGAAILSASVALSILATAVTIVKLERPMCLENVTSVVSDAHYLLLAPSMLHYLLHTTTVVIQLN